MSYSFQVTAPTVDDVQTGVSAKFDEICKSQPDHEADRYAVQRAVGDMLEVLDKDQQKGRAIRCQVNGSIGGQWIENRIQKIQAVNCMISLAYENS